MIKKPKETLATQNFKTACDDLAKAFCKQMDVDYKDSWWVGEVPGDIFCFLVGEMFTNATDMVLAIEHKMSFDEFYAFYQQWTDHDFDTGEPNPNSVNLRSWIMGARPKLLNDKDNDKENS